MTDDRIKSCPFCGSLDLNFVEGSTFRWIVAECQSCGARCGETRVKTLGDQDPDGDKAAALAEWNRRAIEAECRKVPAGYVPVPVEPTASQLDVAVSFALNVKLCNDYNWSAYMRDVYARMIAAAPKPEKVEPVAQEPEYWAYVVNGSHTYFSATEPPEDAYDEGTLRPLYLAPPDHSAEVPMTPAASIFKDEVARLNAEVERLRDHGKKLQSLVDAGLDLCERKDKRIAELEATIEAQRTLYANCIKISHEADELEHKCNRLERQQAVLVEALEEAECVLTDTGCEMTAMKARAALASVKGNAGIHRAAEGRPVE